MDYDVEALSLESPPNPAPLTTYTPSIRVRNNGIHAAIASGFVKAYVGGVQVYSSSVLSEQIDPGDIGSAIAIDDWLPAAQGPVTFYGYVTTERDQKEANNNLAPTTIVVGPPPPPPVPKTLDDIYDALQPLGKQTTLEEIANTIPAAPATEPTLEEVRDSVATAAKEATLVAVGAAIGDTAKEVTQLDVNDKLAVRIPPALGSSGGLKVEGIVATPPPKVPTQLETRGQIEVNATAIELTFALQTRVIFIQASHNNSGIIFVGGPFLNAAGEHALAFLQAGDSIAIEYNDANNPIYVCGSLPGQFIIAGATTEP